MVPLLVVLAALILSLEILQFLLTARLLATLAMAVAWVCFLSRDLQVQSILAALLYHGVIEGYVEWKATFPSVLSTRKDRRVILWLLFWLRVFIWSATASATQGFQQLQSQREQDPEHGWRIVALTFAYCEVLEVLLLLYFADHTIPYRWKQRFLHWLASIGIGLLESRGTLAHVTGLVLRYMPSGVLVILLLVLMYATIRIPWYRLVDTLLRNEDAAFSNDEKHEDDDEERHERMRSDSHALYSPAARHKQLYSHPGGHHQSFQDNEDDDIYVTKAAKPVFVPSGFSSESEDELMYR